MEEVQPMIFAQKFKKSTKLKMFGTFSGIGFFDKNVIISGSGNANSFL